VRVALRLDRRAVFDGFDDVDGDD